MGECGLWVCLGVGVVYVGVCEGECMGGLGCVWVGGWVGVGVVHRCFY